MLAAFRTLVPGQLSRRLPRAALVAASIALGVATLTSTQILNRLVTVATGDSATPVPGAADFSLSNGEAGVSRDLASELAKLPGVQSARPVIAERVRLHDLKRVALLIGVELSASNEGMPEGVTTQLSRPAALLRSYPAFVGRDLGRLADPDGGLPVELAVTANARRVALHPAGTVALDPDSAGLNGSLIVLRFDDAAKLLNRQGLASRIDIVAQPGTDRPALKRLIVQATGARASVETPGERADAAGDAIAGVQVGLSLCGAGALIVGLFLVYNALAVTVVERRREIGILRSLGATRSQVAGLFAAESAMLGVVGATLGVPFGWALAFAAAGPLSDVINSVFIAADLPPVTAPPLLLLACAGAGVLTALLASLPPALAAASDEPADAVRRAPAGAGRFLRNIQGAVALTMIVAGVLLAVGRERLPLRVGSYGGAVLTLTGAMLASPLVAGLLAVLIGPLVARLSSVSLRLAVDNLLRAPGRAGIVVGAQAAGVALMVQIAGVGLSNERPVLAWLDRTVTPDLFVMAVDAAGATNSSLPLSAALADEAARLPGVAHSVRLRMRRLPYHNVSILLAALDTAEDSAANAGRPDRPYTALLARLATEPGATVISDNFAALHGTKVGDVLELPGPRGPLKLNVIGTLEDFSWNRGTAFVDRGWYVNQFADDRVDMLHIHLHDKIAGAEGVKTFARRESLFVMDRERLSDYVSGSIRQLYALLYLQQGVVGVVSALGVAAALSISVLQRRREIGLLRAVGATSGQILTSVLAEAALLGLAGTILGALTGYALEWYVLHVIIWEEAGLLFPALIPWLAGSIIAFAGWTLAVLAGVPPAMQAVRGSIADAVAWE